jgi:Domain of unknown function (DUF4870)
MTRPQSSYPMDPGLSGFGEDAASARQPEPGSPREVHLAMLAYLGIPFTLCVLPLICYLASAGQPPGGRGFARVHTGQALALSLTALLYTLCGLIVFGVLALDSVQVALAIAVPLLALLWLGVLAVVVRSAIAASHGELRPVPRWLRLTRESAVSR